MENQNDDFTDNHPPIMKTQDG